MPNATKYLERLRVPSVMSQAGLWVVGVTKSMRFVCPRFSVLVGFALALTGCGGGGSTTAPVQPQTLSSVVDPLASAAMKQQGIPGMTVALARNGTMLYAKAYGDSAAAKALV